MMDLGSALRVLLRRWWIILIGLVLTMGAAYYVRMQTPLSYQSTARILLLLPPDARGAEDAGSPYIYLPTGLNTLARVAIAAPMGASSRAQMAAEGMNSQFEMEVAPTSPEITISAEGPDPDNVIATRDWLVRRLESNLASIQQEVQAPPQQTAYANVYDAEERPEQVSGDRSRALIAVVGVGGLITLLVTFALDRLLNIRKERRARRAAGLPPGKGRHARRAAGSTSAGGEESPPGDGVVPEKSANPGDEPTIPNGGGDEKASTGDLPDDVSSK